MRYVVWKICFIRNWLYMGHCRRCWRVRSTVVHMGARWWKTDAIPPNGSKFRSSAEAIYRHYVDRNNFVIYFQWKNIHIYQAITLCYEESTQNYRYFARLCPRIIRGCRVHLYVRRQNLRQLWKVIFLLSWRAKPNSIRSIWRFSAHSRTSVCVFTM